MKSDPQPAESSSGHGPSWMAPMAPMIPDHEMVRRIGGGSYGDVWLARTAVGTWRAVKVVFRDRFLDARPYEREFKGIQIFEPLSRSNEAFIDILQIGRNDDEGFFYYVMELADDAGLPQRSNHCQVTSDQSIPNPPPAVQRASQTLPTKDYHSLSVGLDPGTYVPKTLAKVLLQLGRLPVGECLELGLTLNLGLAHLHKAGLIHRDIKPSNIIFVAGVPKLADIGLVIEVAEARSFVGTEGFIPPEGPNSPQADLYSLGKVLYEAGMGKDRKDFPEPYTQIADAPNATDLLEFNSILLKACAANRGERYQSAEEMNADLALLQSGGSVRKQRKLAGQLRLVQRAGAIVTALAAVIGLGWWWQAKQTRVVRELATEKSKLAENLAKLGEENRNRIVRLDIASGIRLLDEGDAAGALLWFADALPLVTNNPAQESIHRIRIQQTMNQIPRPVQMLTHDAPVRIMSFSPDGKRFVTGTDTGWVHVWDLQTGLPLIKPFHVQCDELQGLSFTSTGERLAVTAAVRDRKATLDRIPDRSLAIVEVASGKTVFSTAFTNLLQAQFDTGRFWLATAQFVADGRWLAAVGMDHVIRVVDVRDGHQIAALKGHTNNILGFMTTGDVLVSFSKDRTLRVWRLPSGEPVGNPVPYNPDWPLTPALSGDGLRLATQRADANPHVTETNCVQIWRTDTMANMGGLTGRLDQIGTVLFVGSGRHRRLLSSFGERIRVLDPDTQADCLPPIQTGSLSLGVVDLRDGSLLAAGGAHGLEGIWSLETGQLIAPPFRHAGPTRITEVSQDGSHLATANDDGICIVWRLEHRQEEATLRLPSKPLDQPPLALFRAFSPERSHFLLPLEDGSVRLIDLERLSSRELVGTASPEMEPGVMRFAHSHRQWAIHYSPKPRSRDTTLELWRDDGTSLQHLAIPLLHPSTSASFAEGKGLAPMQRGEDGVLSRLRFDTSRRILALRFNPGDASVTTVSTDREIRTWRTTDGALEHSALVPETLQCHELFPDARTIFASDRVLGFVLYDRVTGDLHPTLPGQQAITALAFDPAGERFASMTEDGWARVWSTKIGTPLSPPIQHGGTLTLADWSPDGTNIAMAGFTPEVRVWNASSGELSLPPLRLGSDSLQTVMWSLDGRFLVARSDENVVRVWDAATGEAVTPMLKHEGHIRLAHLVANNRLITLSLPNLLRAWDLTETRLPADVIMDYAKVVSGRRLNRDAMMQAMKPVELAELCRSVRARAPQLFE